jgi:hypothetical protein
VSNVIAFPDPSDDALYAIPFLLDLARKYYDVIVARLGNGEGCIQSPVDPQKLYVRLCTNKGLRESSAAGSEEVKLDDVPRIFDLPLLLGKIREEAADAPLRIIAIGELL